MKVFVNGIEQQAADIRNFVIYGGGKILFKYDSFRIEPREITTTDAGEQKLTDANRYIFGDITALHLNTPIKAARKENLTRTDNYTLKYVVDYSWESGKTLYIHASEIAVTDIGEVLAMTESDGTRRYLHAVKLHFNCVVTVKTYHAEKIPCDNNWKIPAGGQWSSAYGTEARPSYDTYDDTSRGERFAKLMQERGKPLTKGVIKRWTTDAERQGIDVVTTFRYYTRTEYSPERERVEAIARRLNESGIYSDRETWNHYSVEKLESALGYKLQ